MPEWYKISVALFCIAKIHAGEPKNMCHEDQVITLDIPGLVKLQHENDILRELRAPGGIERYIQKTEEAISEVQEFERQQKNKAEWPAWLMVGGICVFALLYAKANSGGIL